MNRQPKIYSTTLTIKYSFTKKLNWKILTTILNVLAIACAILSAMNAHTKHVLKNITHRNNSNGCPEIRYTIVIYIAVRTNCNE